MLKVVIMIKYFISPQFLADFASWSDVWRSLTLNFQNGKHFSTVSGNWTRISPMGANNSTTELLPWQLTCLKCYAGNHNRSWFFMIVHKLYTEGGGGKSTKWHGTYIPLPPLSLDSNSMVGAEIAGRSMPDEHPPVGPPPLRPPPAVPNTLHVVCDTPVMFVSICFAWVMSDICVSLSGPSWVEDRKKKPSKVDECIPNPDDLLLSVHQKWIF